MSSSEQQFVNIHDNTISEKTRMQSYSKWLIKNGETPQYANKLAFQRITLIVAKDEKLPDGKRRQAWVKWLMSKGETLSMAQIIACKKIP
jgi:hypothetical protein